MVAWSPTFAQATQPKPAAPPAAAPAPVVPFPEGSKIAFIDRERLIAESIPGKAATAKAKALNDKKVAELNEKSKLLQSLQQKLQSGGAVLSDAARDDLQRQVERADTDIQRMQQDAQKELQDLEQRLLVEFNGQLQPALNAVSTEKGLHMVFSAGESGLMWANLGLDITADVIKRLDATAKK
jgi:Skp family chaperone for outer membrane proteins